MLPQSNFRLQQRRCFNFGKRWQGQFSGFFFTESSFLRMASGVKQTPLFQSKSLKCNYKFNYLKKKQLFKKQQTFINVGKLAAVEHVRPNETHSESSNYTLNEESSSLRIFELCCLLVDERFAIILYVFTHLTARWDCGQRNTELSSANGSVHDTQEKYQIRRTVCIG